MHIPKLFTMVFMGALGAGSLYGQTQKPDTDLQAKAREALHQTMSDLDAKEKPTNTPPVAPMKPVEAKAPAKATTPPPVMAKPTPPVVTQPPPAKAVEKPATTTPAVAVTPPSAPVKPTPVKPAPKPAPVVEPKPMVAKPATTAAAPPAVKPTTKPPVAATTAPPAAIATAPVATMTPQQQRLSALLDQYKAGKLNPAEYQEQRAKIMSEK